MNIKNGILSNTTFLKSPHCNQRPKGTDITLLVIHNISLPPGKFGGNDVEDFFLGELNCEKDDFYKEIHGLKVSSHLYIKRTGELVQFVNLDQRAWHAGQSIYNGRSNCNDFSIGIELEGTDISPYTDEQYQKLISVTKELLRYYPKMDIDGVCGHCDIAPDRKTDPGASFNWTRYRQGL